MLLPDAEGIVQVLAAMLQKPGERRCHPIPKILGHWLVFGAGATDLVEGMDGAEHLDLRSET